MATLLMIESWLQSTGQVLPSLIRQRGHEYVLVTRDPELYDAHPVLDGAADVLVVETNELQALGTAARHYREHAPVDGVLTTCDYYLQAAAHCAAALGLPGPRPEVMRTAIRKDLVRDATVRAGLPSPRYVVATHWEACLAGAAQVGYPCVAKPVDLNSGTSVHLVEGEGALKDAFGDITGTTFNTRGQPLRRQVLIEEYLDGPEVSVEAVTVRGRTHILGVTDKVVEPGSLIECGHRFPALLGEMERHAVEELTTDALAAIELTDGLSHTEVRLTADGPRLVELNPRQGGGYIFELVSLVTGVNPLGLVIDLALGDEPRLDGYGTATSAAVSFFLPRPDGQVIDADALAADPLVHRWELDTPMRGGVPRDNNDRIGYVISTGRPGSDALGHAMYCAQSGRLLGRR